MAATEDCGKQHLTHVTGKRGTNGIRDIVLRGSQSKLGIIAACRYVCMVYGKQVA